MGGDCIITIGFLHQFLFPKSLKTTTTTTTATTTFFKESIDFLIIQSI